MIKKISFYWILATSISACSDPVKVLQPETITIYHIDEIVSVQDTLVKPILYKNIPPFEGLPVEKSKERFISSILPAVLIAKHHLKIDRQKVEALIDKNEWSPEDSSFFNQQMEKFKAKDHENLLLKMETHPNSITLAQAAVESGWGSSRFFREANNLFGIWAYKADEPRIPANHNNVYLRKYDDISQSIEDYFVTLGRARPYRQFRQTKYYTDDIHELLPHLKYYSERGMAYVAQLKTIIRQNDLTKYDNYQLDPTYFIEE
ncbi:hypothetical protein GCM10011506_20460 [Marivirga lumbricoides]|uniref:Mannosyl-glycoprotein endo-beta-N-acetylglucosamidase-like domain-containing protein n=1 Tax=Marivirga lumbricoides TaxID=1046115 RepID=A0ABQ1M593_9BACT|nr:hypothetical protein GCM10011506_20460 [Marivirga lumbricoides]